MKTQPTIFDYDTEKVISWVIKQGWSLNLRGRRNEADHFSKKININYQTRGNKLLYTLLHEAGHLIIRNNIVKFMSRYQGITAALVNDKKANHSNFKVDTLKEEFDAWRLGEELAENLGIELDSKAYNKFGNKSLMSYIKWANK
tara:strand:- start:115 stop:546 length:432 start_codon:yes stop_codon:yes gene_type:complete